MTRAILAILLAVSTLCLSVPTAGARPAGPADCTFADSYASFRDALGDEIVGTCVSAQVTTDQGDARQKTTEGTLYWNPATERAVFTDGIRVWRDGPAGIGTAVTIGALSDKTTTREPVVATAAQVLDFSTIDPYEVDDAWDYVEIPELRYVEGSTSCRDGIPNRTAGSIQVSLVNRAKQVQITHTVAAIPDAAIDAWRDDKQQIAAACEDWTSTGESGETRMKLHIAPFLELGDDSFLQHFEMTHV
jgi:hypothetical protein